MIEQYIDWQMFGWLFHYSRACGWKEFNFKLNFNNSMLTPSIFLWLFTLPQQTSFDTTELLCQISGQLTLSTTWIGLGDQPKSYLTHCPFKLLPSLYKCIHVLLLFWHVKDPLVIFLKSAREFLQSRVCLAQEDESLWVSLHKWWGQN